MEHAKSIEGLLLEINNTFNWKNLYLIYLERKEMFTIPLKWSFDHCSSEFDLFDIQQKMIRNLEDNNS